MAPVPLQQGLARLAPLEFPAGWVIGPAAEHGGRIDLSRFGQSGLHGGAVLEGWRQLLEPFNRSCCRRLRQEAGGLSTVRTFALGDAQEPVFGLRLLRAVPPQQGLSQAQLQFCCGGGVPKAAQSGFAASQLREPCGEQLLVLGAERSGTGLAGLQQERFGTGPAGTPAGEVQGIACFEGCREGRRVGGKALQQRQPQLGLLPAQGIEGIGTGGFLRKAPQQFCPEGLGFLGVSTRLGGEGRAFEADRRQHSVVAAVAPALALEPMAPLFRAALGLGAQQ